MRNLVASLCAVVMLTAMAGVPAARAARPSPALSGVSLTTMVRLTVLGGLVRHGHSTRSASQGALSADVPGSLPKAAGPVPTASSSAAAAVASCVSSVKSKLLAGGYSTKLLGLTTSGGESAVLKQITADCTAKKPVDQVSVTSLFKAKKPAVDASNFMFWGWFTPAGPASRTLKAAGYGPSPIALSMKFTYTMKQQPTAQVLKDLGYDAPPNMQALKDVFSLPAGTNSQIMRNIGYGATSNMQGLKDVYRSDAPTSSKILKADGYGATDNLRALNAVFKTAVGPGSKLLANDGYTSSQNAQAMIDVFKTKSADGAKYLTADGYSAKQIGTALRDSFKLDAKGMAQLIKNNGFGASDTGINLRDLYSKNGTDSAPILAQVGYTVLPIAGALKAVFGRTAPQAVGDLKGALFERDAVASAVTTTYTLPDGTALAQALVGSYDACNVGLGVKYMFFANGSAALAQALRAVFGSAQDVTSGLKCAYGSFAPLDIVPLLKGVGFDVTDTAGGIKAVYNPVVNVMAQALKPSFEINGVADTVKSSYTLGNPDLTKALKDGGYEAPDLSTLLHDHFAAPPADFVDAFSLAGFGGVPTVDALKNKFGVTDPASALSLLKSKYSIGEIAAGLKDPYGLSQAKQMAELFVNNFDPEAIASTLGEVYSLALPDTVKAMFDSNYPIDLVSRALDKYPSPQDFTNIPGLLHDAGYDPTAIGNTIHSYFNKPADVVGSYMAHFGGTAAAIGDVLKGDFPGIDPADVAQILFTAAFPTAEVAAVLSGAFGVLGDALKGLLNDIGFGGVADLFEDAACALNPWCD